MNRKEVTWALNLLQERWTELDELIDFYHRRVGADPEVVERYRTLSEEYRERYAGILHSVDRGVFVDLLPEFKMLCEDIKDLRLQFYEVIAKTFHLNVLCTAAGAATVAIAQCILGIELAIATMTSLVCGVNAVRAGHMYSALKKVHSRNERRQVKLEHLHSAVRTMHPGQRLQYQYLALEAISLDEYQELDL